MNAEPSTETLREAAISDRARMEAELAFEGEINEAESRGRAFLGAGQNPLIQPAVLARLLRVREVDVVVAPSA